MGHTAEQRDKLQTPLCGAKKKNGDACRAFAGQGTDHTGFGLCKYHGGSMTPNRKHAAKLQAQERITKIGHPIPVTPGELMQGHVHLAAGYLDFLTAAINSLEDAKDLSMEDRALLRLWNEERKLGPQIAKMAADMGVSERLTELAESQSVQIARIFEAVADELGFSKAVKQALGPAIRRQIALQNGNGGDVIDGTVAKPKTKDKNKTRKTAKR